MSGWIECKLALGGGDRPIYLNLAHVVSMTEVAQGIRIITANGDQWLVEGTDPTELLRQAQTRRA